MYYSLYWLCAIQKSKAYDALSQKITLKCILNNSLFLTLS